MSFLLTSREVVKLVRSVCRSYATSNKSKDVPIVSVPHKMVRQIQKAKRKKLETQLSKQKKVYRGQAIIKCHRKEYNHYKGQIYSEFDPKLLASHGWTHYKSAGDSFTIDFGETNPSLSTEDDIEVKFNEFDLSDEVLANVQKMNVEHATNIQTKVIPKILKGQNVICAAETGSGKTLAYLLPLIEIMNRQVSDALEDSDVKKNAPLCIILLPTRELVDQVLKVAEQLTEGLPVYVSREIGGSSTKSKLVYPKWDRTDVLVTTPGILRKMLSVGTIKSSRLQHMVLDEADTLLDDSFSGEILFVMRKLGIHGGSPTGDATYVNTGVQITLASATLPRDLNSSIGSVISMESFDKVTTKYLHRIMPHVPQTFLRLKSSLKEVEIVKLVKQNAKEFIPTMVFCNKSDTTFWLQKLLRENGVECVVMNAVMDKSRRDQAYVDFRNGQSDILLCTDVGSRGLDTMKVEQVINFDFPEFVSDYVHRAGRVGRVGSKKRCKVISFVTHKWEVTLLWNIETAARKSTAFHNVNANIKRKIDMTVLQKYGAKEDL